MNTSVELGIFLGVVLLLVLLLLIGVLIYVVWPIYNNSNKIRKPQSPEVIQPVQTVRGGDTFSRQQRSRSQSPAKYHPPRSRETPPEYRNPRNVGSGFPYASSQDGYSSDNSSGGGKNPHPIRRPVFRQEISQQREDEVPISGPSTQRTGLQRGLSVGMSMKKAFQTGKKVKAIATGGGDGGDEDGPAHPIGRALLKKSFRQLQKQASRTNERPQRRHSPEPLDKKSSQTTSRSVGRTPSRSRSIHDVEQRRYRTSYHPDSRHPVEHPGSRHPVERTHASPYRSRTVSERPLGSEPRRDSLYWFNRVTSPPDYFSKSQQRDFYSSSPDQYNVV